MPKVAYSEAERERIRNELVSAALELMARQGIQHTTVEQLSLIHIWAMSAAPTRGSQPRYWLSVVPAPLSMMR